MLAKQPATIATAVAATGAQPAVTVPGALRDCGIFVYGTFVGTWAIEISPDYGFVPAESEQWVTARTIGAGTKATGDEPDYVMLAGEAMAVRLNCTAWTSGAINALLVSTY